jgi:putative membrane protein
MIVPKSTSWLSTLTAIRGTTLDRTWPRILVVTVTAVAVTLLHDRYKVFTTSLTVAPFTLIGLALGIFLGFRNNTSYDRFWEGRKLWGALVNTSRSVARQIFTLVDTDDETRRELVYRMLAYVHGLRIHLRDIPSVDDLAPFLPEEELVALPDENNRPNAIAHRMGERFRELFDAGKIDVMHLPVLEESLTRMLDIQGGCERIKSTPIPYSYNVLMHRIVGVYCFALPFGLVATLHDATPWVVALVAYAFFGLDAVGEQIEEPFGLDVNDLPLDGLCTTIEMNLRQRLGETEWPEHQTGVYRT